MSVWLGVLLRVDLRDGILRTQIYKPHRDNSMRMLTSNAIAVETSAEVRRWRANSCRSES
jgi:hypothetical protein